MRLTATSVKNAKPRGKLYRMADGHGLCLEVTPSGGKHWRFRYRFGGKASMVSLGTYPTVSLQEARERLQEVRKQLDQGVDPAVAKKASLGSGATFGDVATEWYKRFSLQWTPNYAAAVLERLERDVYPWLGQRPITDITPPEVLSVIRRIESRGAAETARRQLQKIGQVFRYAVATGQAERDPTQDLKGAIPPSKKRHHASITDPKAVGELLRAIEGYTGSFIVCCALKLAPLFFVRPGELRKAEWSEFDLEAEEWRIPAENMKMREQHIVPLASQAAVILQQLRPLTGSGKYVFPSARSWAKPMSENTVTAALRRMGYSSNEMTGHGFRSMASTLLNEMGWNRDAIERQLAHAERDEVRAAYNYAEFLPERRKMMQAWADYLDSLREGGKVVPLRHVAGERDGD